MEFTHIRYEKDEKQPQMAYITLNRPEKANAISIGRGEMTQEIKDAIIRIRTLSPEPFEEIPMDVLEDKLASKH